MKRLVDIVLALLIVVFSFPLLVLLSLLIWINLGSPILFIQARAGLNGEVFHLFKFRTMADTYGDVDILLSDQERLSNFGLFLRSTSLDELPGLLNVLKGEMSLIGPRPLLVEYLSLYSEKQSRRHEVRPGITGWAQVNGRNAISWDEKFELDVWYVDNQSIWLDIKILWLTVKKVIVRDGIAAQGDVTMPIFRGSKK